MTLKTYQARTMSEVMDQIKRELGPEAVILKTRRFRKGGVFGMIGGSKVWEVQAAPDMNIPPRPVKRLAPPAAIAQAATSGGAELSEAELAITANLTEPSGQVAARMNDIHRMVKTLLATKPRAKTANLPDELVLLRKQLLEQDVAETIADQLIGELHRSMTNQQITDMSVLQGRLADMIADRISISSATVANRTGGPHVVALIGPTGVGKTTTIAKIAANYRLRENKKVGLVTIDTYRIAAVDQLRTYAEIIEVPLQAVLTPGELHRSIRSMGDLDVVLIDTAGRSQNDEIRLGDLKKFIEAAGCNEVHLVLSAAANPRVAQAAVERFGPLGANRIIMTKLDEAETYGMILNIAAATSAALSYVTTGQDVPDDIARADANVLATSVVKGSWHAN